ncbi:MAG: hypothetical protein QHJ73_06340 [Armatimonadota bacterium]|nr:hypothetical protein [Armatimonadota bacterium]
MNKITIEVTDILSGKPDELARHIAAAFYRELRRNGLSATDVIRVASELLRCLNATLSEYQGKVEH